MGDLGSIPGLGGSPGGKHGNPLRIPAWRVPMDRGAWRAAVHGVAKSRTRLSDSAGVHAHGIVSSCHFTIDSDFSKLCFSSLTTSRNKAWADVFAGILFNAFLSWNISSHSNVYSRRNMIQWWMYAPSLALSNIDLWQLLQTECLCLSKIHMLNANARCDGTRSWDLWGVIWSGGWNPNECD